MSENVSQGNGKGRVHELLPKLPENKGTLLLSFTFYELQERMINYLVTKKAKYEILQSSVRVDEQTIENFIVKTIDRDAIFNEIEMENINILFLEEYEQLDFHTFGRTLSLLKVYRMIKSKDLIYILNNKQLKTYFQPIIDVKKK